MLFEEMADDTANLEEFVIVGPFAKISGAEVRAFASVGERIGRGNHDNRQIVETLTGANAAQHFEAVDTGKIEVEEDGVEGRGVGIFLSPFNGSDRHFAIDGGLNVEIETFELNGFANEQGIGEVVFNHQHVQGPRQRAARCRGGR